MLAVSLRCVPDGGRCRPAVHENPDLRLLPPVEDEAADATDPAGAAPGYDRSRR